MQLYDDGKMRGRMVVKGTITGYFNSSTLYDLYVSNCHRLLDDAVRELRHDIESKRLGWEVRHDGTNITVWRPVKHPQQMSCITFPLILMPWINKVEDCFGDKF